MTCAEHLIENAVVAFERGGSYEDFASADCNIAMAETTGISLHDVWAMADYVVHTLKPDWVADTVSVVQGKAPNTPAMTEYVQNYL